MKNVCKLSLYCFLTVFILAGCNKNDSPVSPSNSVVTLDKSIVADQLGNKNGSAENDEISYLNDYFKTNAKGWVLGINNAGESNEVSSVVLSQHFLLEDNNLYKNENELRAHYKNISIRIPYVGIYLLEQEGDMIKVSRVYRAPGPDVYGGEFEEIQITN